MSHNLTWCVVHTQPLKEHLAQTHLRQQGYDVYLPQFKKVRRHARKAEEVIAPLFPRYLFVAIDLETTPWRRINHTRGVAHLLMTTPVTPARVPSGVVEGLKAQELAEGVVPVASVVTFMVGEKVRLLDGALADHVATFAGLDDKGRVQVLLDFMGRMTPLVVPAHGVEAA